MLRKGKNSLRVKYLCLTGGEESQSANRLIRHDVVEAPQLSQHVQARLLLSSDVGG